MCLPSHSAWTDGMIFVVFFLFSFCLVFVFVTVSSITIPSCVLH